MASATPDLRLPSRPQSITALWPVPNYTAWWQRHMGVNNLPRVFAWRCTGRESNPGPLDLESNTLTTTPPSHHCGLVKNVKMLNVKAIIVSKMTSHCAGTVQMREESESGIRKWEDGERERAAVTCDGRLSTPWLSAVGQTPSTEATVRAQSTTITDLKVGRTS